MAILKQGDNPGARVSTGDLVLARAVHIDTTVVKKPLATFAKRHRAFVAAENGVQSARATWIAAVAVTSERDVDQDAAVDALALALASDGASRTAPFRGLSPHAPAKLKDLGHGAEAKAIADLVKKVGARKKSSKEVVAAAKACTAAAAKVLAAEEAAAVKEAAYGAARTVRDGHERPWHTAFASLKRTAKFHDDEGRTKNLHRDLFEAPPKKARTTTKAAKAAKPAATAPAAP